MSTKKLSQNVIIYGLSNVLKSLVPFLMLPILTNHISSAGYGALSIIETIFLFTTPLIILNADGFLSVKFHQSKNADFKEYVSTSLVLSFFATLAFTTIAFLFGKSINNSVNIGLSWIILIPIFTFLKVVPTLTQVLFQAQEKALHHFTFSIFQTLIDFAISYILVVVMLQGFEGRLMGTYSTFGLFSVIGLVILYKRNLLSFTSSINKSKEILAFGLPLLPHALGTTTIALSDRFFISHFFSNQDVGLYSTAYQVSAIMILFSRSVNQAWSPMLFKNLAAKNFKFVKKLMPVLIVVMMLVGLITYMLQDLIFDVLVGKSFHGAKQYFNLLLLGFFFQSVYFVVSGFFFFYHKTKTLAACTLFTALLNIFLNYFFIQKYGVMGAAYSTVISCVVYATITYTIFVIKIKPLIPSKKQSTS